MHRKKFQFSAGFVNKLVELTEGKISSRIFEQVLVFLETETKKYYFTQSSEANLLRIFSSIYDKTFFFDEIIGYPHHGEILVAISSCSDFLTDIIVRYPQFLYQVFDQEYLSKKFDLVYLMKEVEDGAGHFKSFNSKLNFLRQIKQRFILKIGLADILGIDELISTTEQLSFLAKSLNSKLFEICYQEVLNKYGITDLHHKYCLCSLGKLGGNELNYSSDVDLVLFYDFNENIGGSSKDYHELLSEAAQLFIKSSTEISDRGYIYRVDFRLRPDGKFSELCKSLVDYTKYYETRGEDWERQMLIKLDYICGDENLYNQFFNFVQPYIFPSTYSSSIKEKIRQMKSNIELHNKEKENVKTFIGGIRDIEFSVQALQLINGGKSKSVRSGNTLKVISLLTEQKFLTKRESTIFSKAYIFFRRLEHFLQLMNDTQTHIISQENELLHKLINYLGLKSKEEFNSILKSHRTNVRNVYNQILKTESSNKKDFSPQIKFKETKKAEKNLNFLRTGEGLIGRKEFDSRTTELFSSIQPTLIGFLKKIDEPDVVLNNFVKIIQSSKIASIWYSEFFNKKFFAHFLKVCHYSQKAVDLISTNMFLEEFFLSRKVFVKISDEPLNQFNPDEIVLILSTQYALGLINSLQVSEILSSYIAQKIESHVNKSSIQYNYFIGGLGSFGSANMNFASDVDLIIVTDNVADHPNIQKDFQKLINALSEIIKPFAVDFKLRPEGKSSPLVWGIENYNDYLDKRARVWEFQSLLKLKYICGDFNLFNRLRKHILEKVRLLDKAEIRKEIVKMYSTILRQTIHSSDGSFNIKKDRGGLLTIDFILQSICLNYPELFEKCIGNNFTRIFQVVKKHFSASEIAILKSNFIFLKHVELALQNIYNVSKVNLPSNLDKKNIITSFMKLKSVNELDKKIKEIIKSNNSLFEKYVSN
ncbi:MAG: hypothetical protein NTZ27_13035 [Ignavibacteriales bacterium]|nr:hypothetical protein [Ignavibacteriales bacterium]